MLLFIFCTNQFDNTYYIVFSFKLVNHLNKIFYLLGQQNIE